VHKLENKVFICHWNGA